MKAMGALDNLAVALLAISAAWAVFHHVKTMRGFVSASSPHEMFLGVVFFGSLLGIFQLREKGQQGVRG